MGGNCVETATGVSVGMIPESGSKFDSVLILTPTRVDDGVVAAVVVVVIVVDVVEEFEPAGDNNGSLPSDGWQTERGEGRARVWKI